MSKSRKFMQHWGTAVAFVLLAFFAGVAINGSAKHTAKVAAKKAAQVNYVSQYAGCLRGNILRVEINGRVGETDVTRAVVVGFLRSAETARWSAYRHEGHHASDRKAALAYAKLVAREDRLRYHEVPIVNCKQAVKKP